MNRTYYSIKIEHLIEKLRENLVGWRIIPPSNIKEGSIRLITPESLGFYLFPGERLWELIPVLSSSLRRVRIGPWSLSSVLDAREVGRDIPWKIKTIQSLVEYLKTEEFRLKVALEHLKQDDLFLIACQADQWQTDPLLKSALIKYNPSGPTLVAKKLLLKESLSETERETLYNYLTENYPTYSDRRLKNYWLSLLLQIHIIK